MEISSNYIYFISDKDKSIGMESSGKKKDRRIAIWELQVQANT